jgi:Ca2+-binding RTX toxin-like protein
MAKLSEVGFFVVWETFAQDGSAWGVFGQRLDALGAKVGPEFPVTSYTLGGQTGADVASLSDGGFIVTWTSGPDQFTNEGIGDGDGSGIFAQRFTALGAKNGDEFRINSTVTANQFGPAIAELKDGQVAAAWISYGPDAGVYARVYDSSGQSVRSEFKVNIDRVSGPGTPSITPLNNGGFLAVWLSVANDNYDVSARRFDAAGQPVGDEFVVNTISDGFQTEQAAAGLADGGFVVTWRSQGGIHAQRYNADGTTRGGEFVVNTTGSTNPEGPTITALSNGGFLIGWSDMFASGLYDSGSDLYARAYDSAGIAQGLQFRINAITNGQQYFPSVTDDGNGGFVAVWMGHNEAGEFDVYTRTFSSTSANAAPVAPAAEFALDENEAATSLGTLVASDPNGDPLTFAITSGNDAGLFAIDLLTGALSTTAPLDFERAQFHDLSIAVSDGLLSTTAPVRINVRNTTIGDVVVMPPPTPDGTSTLTYTAASGFDTIVGSTDPTVTEELVINIPLTGGAGGAVPAIGPSADGTKILLDFDGDGTTDLTVSGIEDLFLNGNKVVIAGNLSGTGLSPDTIHYQGTSGADIFDGSRITSNHSVEANGRSGDDQLLGGAGDDILDGGDGADRLSGGGNADRLVGGAGADTADYSTSPKGKAGVGVHVDLATNANSFGDAAGDQLSSIENIRGSAFADSLRGDDGANRLWGEGGADELSGRAANDSLDGGAGNDLLNGGGGFDTLAGGIGKDRFVFSSAAEISVRSGSAWAQFDRIADFEAGTASASGNIDLIDLGAIDANARTSKNDGFTFLGQAAFDGKAGQLRWQDGGAASNGFKIALVQGDLNGDRVADFQLELVYSGVLSASDFLF